MIVAGSPLVILIDRWSILSNAGSVVIDSDHCCLRRSALLWLWRCWKLTQSMRNILGLAFGAIDIPNMDCADIAPFQLSFGDIIVAGGSDQVAAFAAWRKIGNEMPCCTHQRCTVLQ